jgi:hypothetical protein
MKSYLLSIYQPQGPTPPPEELRKIMREVNVILDDARRTRAWVFNGALEPPAAARVIRDRGGDAIVTDGPYIETKEYLGGFLLVRAADEDAAIDWARRLARAVSPLAIEVRAFQPDPA